MTHRTAKMSKEVIKKCPLRNTMVQLSTPYTNISWTDNTHTHTDLTATFQVNLG